MRLLAFVLSFYLIFTPSLTFASVASGSTIGGWQWVSTVRDGLTSVYTASKKTIVDGATIVRTSTARITPTAAQVGRFAGRGAAGIAIALFDVTVLDGIDWVMSPEGGLSYTQLAPEELRSYDTSSLPSWAEYGYSAEGKLFPSFGAAVAAWCSASPSSMFIYTCRVSGDDVYSYTVINNFGDTVGRGTSSFNKVVNPGFLDTSTRPERTPVTIAPTAVGDRIIDLARPDAPPQTQYLALDIVHSAADSAWDDSKPNYGVPPSVVESELTKSSSLDTSSDGTSSGVGAGSSSSSGTGTSEGSGAEGTFELPKFCNWVPIVCEASVSAINFFQSMTSFFDYDSELYDDLGTVDTKKSSGDQSRLSSDLNNFRNSLGLSSASCPSSFTIAIPKITSVDIDLTYWCTLMGIVKLLLHLGVCFIAFRIISSAVQEF